LVWNLVRVGKPGQEDSQEKAGLEIAGD
jgi:hypothetical protein